MRNQKLVKSISKKLFLPIISSVAIIFFASACNIFTTLENIGKLKFNISSATNFNLAGINIQGKNSLNDFNSIELLKLTVSHSKGNLPLRFTLNVEAKYSNEKNFINSEISISSFPYKLLLNDKVIINGDIDKPIYFPNNSPSIIIPLKIEFDIVHSCKDRSINDILNFVLNISGMKSSSSNIKLIARPTLNTPIGEIKSPKEITIVDQEYN